MSTSFLNFKINQPHVVAENFDDEVIVINLERGNYYSIAQSGVPIWNLVSQGATGEEIMASLSRHYQGDSQWMQTATQAFLYRLQVAELIVASPNGAVQTVHAPSSTQSDSTLPSLRLPFVAPILQEFTDMQDLLLLDPIHEVDARGWPRK